MFDTFQGLPVHALIVHATVVLLPLMCLVTVLVAVRPRLRAKYAWWTFAADVALIALLLRDDPEREPAGGPAGRRARRSSSTPTWATS